MEQQQQQQPLSVYSGKSPTPTFILTPVFPVSTRSIHTANLTILTAQQTLAFPGSPTEVFYCSQMLPCYLQGLFLFCLRLVYFTVSQRNPVTEGCFANDSKDSTGWSKSCIHPDPMKCATGAQLREAPGYRGSIFSSGGACGADP